jgi:uncharacterized protein (DUF2235 family)
MKRIITCSDGTWNRPGTTDRGIIVKTNVEKMFNTICSSGADGIQQCKIYDEGVGTGYSETDKISGGLTGHGLDKHIQDMYTFICLNYEPGDHIFLFGFSRGAYTARSIAGFIRNCGVLRPEHIGLVAKAFQLYRNRNDYTTPDSDLMKSFKRNFCFEDITRIKFIGVWDTVGSLGIPLPWYQFKNKNQYKFHDVTLSSTVDNAYHALAIDERRGLFTPTLWEKSKTATNNPNVQDMEQRWFSGVHSNIGGGYADSGLSDIALDWLIQKAKNVGLCYDDERLKEIKPNNMGELRNSYTLPYWFWRPSWRKIDLTNDTNQAIDESVSQRYKSDKKYRPANLKGFESI